MLTYITLDGEANLKNFEYQGGNDSITYQYLWSPLGDYLLKYIPHHIAPNTITTIALVILTVSHVIFVKGLKSQQEIDGWRLIIMGLSILIYQNLDNLDGKQARRTKSSSPLGMLFDHGADAVGSFLISIQVLEILYIKSGSFKIFTVFTMVMVIYFCAMWSQYSIGYFRLGKINPIDEGLPSYALFSFLSIFIPSKFWNTFHLIGTYNEEFLVILLVFAGIIIYFMTNKNYSNAVREKTDISYALMLPLSYGVMLLGLYLSQKNPMENGMLPIYYGLMFSWSRNMIEMQLFYVTKQRFNPFNIGTIGFIGPALGYLFLDVNPEKYFWGVAFLSGILFFQFVISVIRQATSVLNIEVFSIKKTKLK